jgi:hypothetical protein
VTNLCLKQLGSARRRHEVSTGSWLPEPVLTSGGELGPLETAEQRDLVSFGVLILLEKLSPAERAVFVLREAFGYGYAELAQALGRSAGSCRQLHRRAVQRLGMPGPARRFRPDAGQWRELTKRFLAAAARGDVLSLERLLADDVVYVGDGAGSGLPLARKLRLGFFASRRFSVAISSMGLVNFGLYGALFLVTQFLQFDRAYTPLQAGLRILPAAGAVAVVSPGAAVFVRLAGTKFTVVAGLLVIAVGLWMDSGLSITSNYGDIVPGMVLLGIGAGLAIPAAIESVMGSLPRGDTAVGSATNGTFMQLGGALGVAVIGSLLATRYQARMTSAVAPYRIPHAIHSTILGSIGGALDVAARQGGAFGTLLAHAARSAFLSGANLGLRTAAVVALAGCVIALAALPGRSPSRPPPSRREVRRFH